MHGMSSEGQFLARAEMQLRLEALALFPFKKKPKNLSPLPHSLLVMIAEGKKMDVPVFVISQHSQAGAENNFFPARSHSNEELISTAQ